jgi:hypothetical protein
VKEPAVPEKKRRGRKPGSLGIAKQKKLAEMQLLNGNDGTDT